MSDSPATPFCCKHCGAPVGRTTATALLIEDLEIFVPFKFRHKIPGCNRVTPWKPLTAPKMLSLPESAAVQLH